MITLVAYAPEDGWGFAETEAGLARFSPPYKTPLPVPEVSIERAVTIHGYRACERPFETEEALVAFLRAEVVRSCPPPTDTDTLRADLLALADPEEIDFYLEKANLWRASGRTKSATNLLEALRGAAQITEAQRTEVEALLALPEAPPPAPRAPAVTPGEAPPDAF